jgi:8-oxo-dGTP pyrophosphatase MutT (NUDIX family)
VGEARKTRPAGLGLTRSVRAAGGVVWRRDAGNRLEVLLVHRPEYDDWTLPKGKNLPGEDDLVCALREVEEETGLLCEPEEELVSTSYRDTRGRAKTVRYWAMRPLRGSFSAHDEIDEVRWLRLPEAANRLSHERDRGVLASFERTV